METAIAKLGEVVARAAEFLSPKTLRLASAEMSRNRLSKSNDLIERAMM
jgi:hypothetical protein